MKKIILTLSLLFLAAINLHAYNTTDSYRTWRSTEISGAFTNFLVATGAIVLADITVTSGSILPATFRYFNSTGQSVHTSTSIFYDTDTTGDIFPLEEGLSNGFSFTTTGNSLIRVRWDWSKGYLPLDQVTKGIK